MKTTMIAATMAAMATSAVADEYTLQSAFGGLPVLHPTAERFVSSVKTLTGGEVDFSYHKAGELSPPFEIFDNVSAGALDAAWSWRWATTWTPLPTGRIARPPGMRSQTD